MEVDANGFLTPRNLWNLSVQTAYIGIMATGMVLVIITRNIDLSVGSVLGFVGMVMGLLQVEWLPPSMGIGHPAIWIIAVVFAIALGALIGMLQGAMIAYLTIPGFINFLLIDAVWTGADREACIAAGMNYFLSKPVKIDVLRAALAKVVQGRITASSK